MTAHFIHDVIIIGAGASGLFCAAVCARRGRSVLVLDHAPRAASKVRVSGGGRCNFTNLDAGPGHYLSRNPHFAKSALARFTPRDILALAGRYHIAYCEKEAGQIFCVKTSRDIIDMLEQECRNAGAATKLSCRITGIGRSEGFTVETNRGRFRSASLVVATGGLSYASLGATGFGHEIAGQFGIAVVPPRPALVPFVAGGGDRKPMRELAGVSLPAAVTCRGRRFSGSILFTHKGLSGPAMLQASLYWEPGEEIRIDLLPDRDIQALFKEKRQSRMLMPNLLSQVLPKRLAQSWCEMTGAVKPLDQTSDAELRAVAERLHAWEIVPKGTEGYATAEVTAGGVDTNELSSRTMEAKKVPGLYFIGEVVDVTGELGGFNLHWAWASAHAAGEVA